jgi:hypothetical protein
MRTFLIVCVFALAGCSPSVPNKVTPDEYQLYSEWTLQHFAVKTPDHVFFSSRTFTFDPLDRFGCGDRLHADNAVAWSLIKQLHALGEAEYPLDFYQPGRNLHISWPYKEVDGLPAEEPGTYRLIGFSRVAFNRDHTEALFAISDSCGGECGSGGARTARRENGKWIFRNTTCYWVY